MSNLELFPLGVVLFPESALPLHIFEEKYKILINRCLKYNTPFGVNSLIKSKMSNTGCSAVVSKVLNQYEDGKLDIIVTGLHRYNIMSFEENSEDFLVAEIDYFDDFSEIVDDYKLNKCLNLYNEMVAMLEHLKIPKIDFSNVNLKYPSFFIAQKSGLTMSDRQKLLELRSENKRLAFLYRHLKSMLPIIKEADTIDKLIANDGYYIF